MAVRVPIIERATLAGRDFVNEHEIVADGAIIKSKEAIPPAKTGTLTTRAGDTEGTFTMAAEHGIETGDRLDIYWDGGHRRGVTVGTVAGNSVPIETATGAGDNLPPETTPINAMVPHEEEFLVTGDNVEAILLSAKARGLVVFAESDDSEIESFELFGTQNQPKAFIWEPSTGAANPLASEDVAKVFFSHANSAAPADMVAAVVTD